MIWFKWSARIAVAAGLPVILAACAPAASRGNPAAGVPVPSGWTAATPVPGLAGLGTADMNVVTTVSCTAPGDCTAGGDYLGVQNATGEIFRPFVVTESGGTWGTAQEVPGVGEQPAADPATLAQISCSSPGNCVAVGNYSGVAGDDTGKG